MAMRKDDLLPQIKNVVFALFCAVVLWYVLDKNVRKPEPGVPVELSIQVPPGFAVKYAATGSRQPPSDVTVTVTGPKQAFERLRPVIRATRRLELAQGDEDRTITLELEDFTFDLGSPELTVAEDTISPRTVDIIVSKVDRRDLRVDVDLQALPAGWRVAADAGEAAVRATPTFVEATGPARDLSAAQALKTAPIDIERRLAQIGWKPTDVHRRTLIVPSVPLRAPEGTAIEPVQRTVQVSFTVEPEPATRTMEVRPAIAAEQPFDWKLHRLELPDGALGEVQIEIEGPQALLQRDRELLDSLHVYAVLTRQSVEQVPLTPGKPQLRELEIVVYPPPGLRWTNADRAFRFLVRVQPRVAGPGG